MTIYFVDEDYSKLFSWIMELEFRGYQVRALEDADRALKVLLQAQDIDWVIIDVMLAASEQPDSRYEEDRTDQGLTTGLVLLNDLCELRPELFPSRVQLLTAATTATPLIMAKELAAKLKIEVTLKSLIDSPRDFGEVVEAAMRTAGEMPNAHQREANS